MNSYFLVVYYGTSNDSLVHASSSVYKDALENWETMVFHIPTGCIFCSTVKKGTEMEKPNRQYRIHVRVTRNSFTFS